jgi:hypothetical protein
MSTKAFLIILTVVAVLTAAVVYMHGPGSHQRMHALHAAIHGGH